MTLRDLFSWADQARLAILISLTVPIIVTVAASLLQGKQNSRNSPWRYVYGIIVYFVCVPGILAAVTIFYSVLFIGDNLIDINLITFAYPVVTMIIVLTLIRKNIRFDDVPGFYRITGLMIMFATIFVISFGLLRLRILLVFGTSIWSFFIIATLLFILLKWGRQLLFSSRKK